MDLRVINETVKTKPVVKYVGIMIDTKSWFQHTRLQKELLPSADNV